MSRFLETSQFLVELNALWDKHAMHIAKANTTLEAMLKTTSKIPSTYISTLKSVNTAQTKMIQSTTELNNVTKQQVKEIAALITKRNALLSNTKSLDSAIASLEDKLTKANAKLSEMKDKTAAMGNEQSKTKPKIVETENEVERLTKKLDASSNAVSNFSKNAKVGFSMVGSLMTAFGIQQGLFLAADIAKNIYNTTKELQSLDLALRMVSGTQEEYIANQSFISGLAEKWGIEIKSLTMQYTQFYTAAKGILSLDKIKVVFESIAKSGALMGLSVEKQNAAFYAFEQMMSKGVVASEELKKQLGNAMPGAMKAAGMAYMELHPKIKSIQEAEQALMEDMKRGAIDSATYVPLIVKNFEKLYGIETVNKVETLQAAQERLVNSWTDLVRTMNESNNSGLSRFLSDTMAKLSNFVDFTKLLFKDEGQLTTYFKNLGKSQGLQEFQSVMNNIASATKEQQEATKKEMLYRERENIRINNAIVAAERKKRESITGGDRALFHLQTKLEEDALVKIGKSAEIIKQLKQSNIKQDVVNEKKVTEETEKERKARLKLEKEHARDLEKLRKDEYDANLSNLEREKFDLEERMKDKKNTYSDNLRLAFQIGVKEQEIAKLVHDEELRLAGDSINKRIVADNKYYKEKIKLAKDYLKMVDSIEFKPQYKDKNKVADEETYGSGVFETNEKSLDEMKRLWKEQQDEKDRVAKQEADRLKAMRDVLNDVFKEFGQATGFEKTMDMFAKVGKNGKTFWENLLGLNGGKMDLKEGLTAGLTLTQDIGNKIADTRQQHYEEELERIDKMKEYSLQMVGDNEAAKAKIEEDYEKKHAEIVKRQAKAKKQQALFNIAMDTAQAVMGLWVNPGFPAAIPMTIVVGALGIAQAAMVAAKPLPSFYTGTDYAPEGFANTDERGAELHLDKNNKVKDFGSNKGPRIKYLSEGDKIIPAGKTAELLRANQFSQLDEILALNNISYHDDKNIQLDVSEIVSGLDSLKHTIENKETSEEYYDERGWTKYKKINNQRIEDKNNRIRFKKSIL